LFAQVWWGDGSFVGRSKSIGSMNSSLIVLNQ
jgi:hypothetical protein